MANVKVFADRQTDGQAKNYMPPIYRYGGIKKQKAKYGTSDLPYRIPFNMLPCTRFVRI